MFSSSDVERYSRQIALSTIGADGQRKLQQGKVLIVGLGGLGSPAALYCAAAGVGTLGLADFDRVELSNLHRQILFELKDVGSWKAQSAKKRLQKIQPDARFFTYRKKITQVNLSSLVKRYDIVIDATDDRTTKQAINLLCVQANKPWVSAGIRKNAGQVFLFTPKNACLNCVFPQPAPDLPAPSEQNNLEENCAVQGVFGPCVGTLGNLQALIAMHWLISPEFRRSYLTLLDFFPLGTTDITLTKQTNCWVCNQPVKKSKQKKSTK